MHAKLLLLTLQPGQALAPLEVAGIAAAALLALVVGWVAWKVLRRPQARPPRPIGDDATRREPLDAPTVHQRSAADTARDQERQFLRSGLAKTRSEGFVSRIGQLFGGRQLDAALVDEIEEVLLRADLGARTCKKLLDDLRTAVQKGQSADPAALWANLRQHADKILAAAGTGSLNLDPKHGPAVLMVVGVNGSGKTTTIGKLAHRVAGQGRKVLVAAGDTYRAAAVDQLDVWCQRAGVPLHRGKDQADPASVCFAAIERGKAEGYDLVIVDTAGRLHTNHNLMEELKKVGRVVGKAHAGAPHEVLLVLDATMGQNAVKQAELFKEAVAVTGIALTKLDGTAKGGVVLAIAETMGLPVKLVGVGEKMQDLRDFDAQLFLDTLFEGAPGADHG